MKLQTHPTGRPVKVLLILILSWGAFSFQCSSQETYKLEELFMDAETWYYFQDYETALPLYKQVHQQLPDHDNVNSKIGFCYLNIDGQKHKAIPYLKEAAKNTTFNFPREAFYQRKAPVDAIFYLGNAYLINNQIDKALEAFQRFRKKLEDKRGLLFRKIDFDLEYLQLQIEACRRAKKMMDQPVNYSATNIGAPINTPLAEYNPVISGDGNTLAFNAEKKFYTGVFMSRKKENGQWGAPVNLLPQLGIDGDCETTSLSHDGTELYLYREDDLDGNLYVSHYRDGTWSKIEKLGEHINTKYWESHASISRDKSRLYFTSNRPGGYGDLDIYVSRRQSDGSWSEPKNMGPTINTPWREDTPFLTDDGKRLFFSSEGHDSMGRLDVMVSHRTPQGWAEPQNLGYPINTTDHDRFFLPIENGSKAYYARYHHQPPGGKDIFQYHIDVPAHLDFIDVEGIMTYDNPEEKNKKEYRINLIDTRNQDTLLTLNPDKQTGQYQYSLNEAKDHLIMETPRLEGNRQYLLSSKIDIQERYLEPGKLQTKADTAFREPQPSIDLDRQVITVSPGQEQIKIKLNLEGGKQLKVNTFRNDTLLNTETFPVEEGAFTYEYKPGQQQTRLTFELTDEMGHLHTRTVDVLMEPTIAEKTKNEKDSAQLEIAEKTQKEKDSARLEIGEKSISFAGGKKKVRIRLHMDEGSKLIVSTHVGDELINQEEFQVDTEDFTYEFEPRKEKSRIHFKVVRPQEQVTSKEIILSHQPINAGLERLLNHLNRYPSGTIGQELSQMESRQPTAQDFFGDLFENPPADLDISDMDALMYSMILLNGDNVSEMHQSFTDLSDGLLNNYLERQPVDSLTTKKDLLRKLRAAAGEPSYTEESLRQTLMKYLNQTYQPGAFYEMALKLSELNADSIFTQLGYDAAEMVSIQDMLDLIQNSDHPDKMKILALLEGMDVSHEKTGTNKLWASGEQQEEEAGDEDQRHWSPWIIAGGLILLVFLVWFDRRRKKHRKKN